MKTRARVAAAALISLSVLATSACGSDDKASDKTSSSSTSTSPDATVTADGGSPQADGPECTIDDIKVEGAFGESPTVTIPDNCAPPTTLLSKDLVKGSGPAAKAGDTVDTNYQLTTWSDKTVLDSSFERGQTFPIEDLGNAPVIDGWNQGLMGIQKGTRRLLVIPPDLAYGDGGGRMTPNETLVFVVDAVSVS